jgi:hypothetical protein
MNNICNFTENYWDPYPCFFYVVDNNIMFHLSTYLFISRKLGKFWTQISAGRSHTVNITDYAFILLERITTNLSICHRHLLCFCWQNKFYSYFRDLFSQAFAIISNKYYYYSFINTYHSKFFSNTFFIILYLPTLWGNAFLSSLFSLLVLVLRPRFRLYKA